jgi:hypothetical protein
MDTDTLTEAPQRDLDETLTAPGERECLPCYLNRMLATVRCNNELRWAEIWGRQNNARGLRRWLQSNGGYCDCEVLFNVYPDVLPEDDNEALDACLGIRSPGSTQPCPVYVPDRGLC